MFLLAAYLAANGLLIGRTEASRIFKHKCLVVEDGGRGMLTQAWTELFFPTNPELGINKIP